MSGEERRLLIVGLDGATFDVLDPLVDGGHLSTIPELIEDGFRTELESTYPPITGPAWTSLATGLNPGNTGVFDFLNRTEPDSYALSPIDSSYFRGRAFWDYLGTENIRTGLLNYPLLYPPYEMDGFAVSGLGASADQGITYPPSLQDELDEVTGGYEVKMPPYGDPMYEDNEEQFLTELRSMLETRIAAAEHLVSTRQWTVFVVVFSATDLAQHYLWKHWDETHPDHDPVESPRYRQEFVNVWERLDAAVGDLVDLAGPDADVLVLSDHGFGPQHGCFNVNAWLEREGFLVENSVRERSLLSIAESTIEPVIERVSKRGYTYIRRLLGDRLDVSRPSLLDRIDRAETVAVSLGSNHNVAPIYVLDTDDRERIVERLLERLGDLDASSDLPVELDVHRGEDVYDGTEMPLAPDVLVNVSGYEAAVDKRAVDGPIYRPEAYSPNQTGLHRQTGVLFGSGPGLADGEVDADISLLDVAPTILYLYGYDVAGRFDGDPRVELLAPWVVDAHPGDPLGSPHSRRREYGSQDEANVVDQLEDLGYL